jgi:hypothetical protein
VVRRVAGVPLDEFVRARLYATLGMSSTRFRPPASWRPRIAPTEEINGRLLRGEVHDGPARFLGGVAGHAGLFSTADDLGRLCRMLLAGGTFGGGRYFRPETVRAMFAGQPVDESIRALGWDVASPFSTALGSYFPIGSVGHTGFTGTAVWLDPPSRTYLIILSNRVHARSGGKIQGLRRRVSAAVGAALFGRDEPPFDEAAEIPAALGTATPNGVPPASVRTGLDHLAAQGFALLAGRTVGLVTNQTGVDAQGRRGIDLLARAPDAAAGGVHPEHGSLAGSTRGASRTGRRHRSPGLSPTARRAGRRRQRRGSTRWSDVQTWASATTRT